MLKHILKWIITDREMLIQKTILKEIKELEKRADSLIIEKKVDRREEQQIIVVQSILENHIRKKKKRRA